MSFDWTDERCDELRKLWGEGLSCSKIAAEMGCASRNAVIGKVTRLGLPQRYRSPGERAKAGGAAPRSRKPPRSASRNFDDRRYATPEPDDRPMMANIDDQAIPQEQRKTLLQLGAHDCRWPVGDVGTPDFFFCGAEALDDRPYCAGHCARAGAGYGHAVKRAYWARNFDKERAA